MLESENSSVSAVASPDMRFSSARQSACTKRREKVETVNSTPAKRQNNSNAMVESLENGLKLAQSNKSSDQKDSHLRLFANEMSTKVDSEAGRIVADGNFFRASQESV